MPQLGFEPIFDSFLLAGLLALVLVLLLGVRPQFGALSRGRRTTLTVLRLAIVLLATAALLRPTWITTIRTPRTSVVLLLLDASRSMLLPSGRSEQSRWQAQNTSLAAAQAELAALARKLEVRTYSYDQKLQPLKLSAGSLTLPAAPAGQQTDIGTTLHDALRAEQGKQVAAVILLGDGAQTAFEPLVETQQAARKVRDDFTAPLYTVTFGLSGDEAQARDIAIERLDEHFTVFVKNEMHIRGQVRVRGYVKQDVPVELSITNSRNEKQTIGQRPLRADEDNQLIEIEFAYTPTEPGHYKLTLQAQVQPGELVDKNNKLDAYLTVLEGGLRVLYVDNVRFEQKFLRRAINASPDIELDDRFIDRRSARQLPIDLGPDFSAGKYDAFILGDVDQAALGTSNLQKLAAAVEQGKGLLMLGGRSSFGRGRYFSTPLADVLPIQFDSLEAAEFSELEQDRFFLSGPLPLIPSTSHAVTHLAASAENASAWSRLPPLAWANRFAGVKPAPGVRVLLETPRKEPLLVSGEYGSGRTLAFAGESTYLWPLHGFAKEHNRFWRQVVLWLARREDYNRDDVWIKLDQRRFNQGSRVQFETGARNAAGEPIADARLEMVLVNPSGRRSPVQLARGDDRLRGAIQAEAPGDYALEATAFAGDKHLGTARAEFLVFDRDVELSTPAADPDLMATLAAWTRREGGRALAPEELPALLTELAARPNEYEVRQTRWKLGATSADAWTMFLLMATCLTVEWFLRKRWGLV